MAPLRYYTCVKLVYPALTFSQAKQDSTRLISPPLDARWTQTKSLSSFTCPPWEQLIWIAGYFVLLTDPPWTWLTYSQDDSLYNSYIFSVKALKAVGAIVGTIQSTYSIWTKHNEHCQVCCHLTIVVFLLPHRVTLCSWVRIRGILH